MQKNKNASITLTRQEFYNKVWGTPIVRLAEEYGLSDRGLAKICQRHDIPRPPRGYWAKREHGHSSRQTPLPKGRDPNEAAITIWPDRVPRSSARRTEESQIEIVVPETVSELHPLVARTEKSLRSARPNEKGLVSPRAKRAIRVAVAPESIDRAVRILDTLIKELEKRALTVQVMIDDKGQSETIVTVDDEEIGFHISEKTGREERQLSQRELREKERHPWSFRDPQYRFFPTGVLSLRILTVGDRGMIRTWSDLKKRPLEKRLFLFVSALEAIAIAIKRERREDEERRQRWAEERRIRRENRRLIDDEEERLKQPNKQVKDWEQSRRIRAYVEAARNAAFDSGGQMVDERELKEWITWATSQADRLDPLAKTPPSILDRKPRWGSYWG